MTKKKEVNNWIYNGQEITSLSQMPEGTIGFIYKIYNLDTGKYYIGRKTCSGLRKRKLTAKEKLKPENKRKTFVYETKEASGWKTYCGSNEVLKKEFKEGNKIKKEILHYCSTKAQITYMETKEILCSGALLDELSYNGWIKATIYKKYLINID